MNDWKNGCVHEQKAEITHFDRSNEQVAVVAVTEVFFNDYWSKRKNHLTPCLSST